MSQNDEGRLHSAPATSINQPPETVAADLDVLDVRERLVAAIDELEAGDAGIDAARALLFGLLEDLDVLAAAMTLRDIISRIVTAACAIEDGDYSYAHRLLLDLELDLEALTHAEAA